MTGRHRVPPSGAVDPGTATGHGSLLATTVRILGDLVAFPTATSESNLELIAYADRWLRAAGATTELTYGPDGQKANLFATIGPSIDGGVVLSGHTDVVAAGDDGWTSPPFAAVRRGDRIHGRGTADMKGFIACALAMAPSFAAVDLAVPVHLALTFDEEVGFVGAPILVAQLVGFGPIPGVAIVGEPTSMKVVAGHKGCQEFTTTITGVEGHASMPGRGVDAIGYALRYAGHLLGLREELAARAPPDGPFDPPGSTIHIGTVHGGTARNVIAGSCVIEWELRPTVRADADHVRAAVHDFETVLRDELRSRHPAADVRTEVLASADGLEAAPGSDALVLMEELLGTSDTEVVAFGTEAGYYQRAGIPAVVCGPGGIEVAHQSDEYIDVGQLQACLVMLERLVERLRAR